MEEIAQKKKREWWIPARVISKLHRGISVVCVGYVVNRGRKGRQEDVLDQPWEEENLSGKENELPEKAGAMVRGDLVVSGPEAPPTL